jgi:hypothetical protein
MPLKKHPKIKFIANPQHEENIFEIEESRLLRSSAIGDLMCPLNDTRTELAGKAYYLSNGYNWQIVTDSSGYTCLVAYYK